MEYRKLIAFGKSSYVISLPKAWIRQQKMKKGDLIYLEERENSLLLSSKIQGSPEPKKITISVDNKKIPQIRREVNAAYIENYREIALVGKQLKQQSAELLDMARSLIALEVLEITTEKIVTKDFLDMDKVSIKELIKKMDMIVRSMLKDCTLMFVEDSAENIALRDHDVNRLSFLLFRVIRYSMRNPARAFKNSSLSIPELLNHYILTSLLENIADEAKRMSRVMKKMKLSKKEKEDCIQVLKNVEELYLAIMKAYYIEDRNLSLELS
ncbi:phosphate uptake regulator PhoU, partial [Candidatus Woesearchaeota archaeon]|nr:phosphate uptake regulator PhoU [Candidatus Woesearchaeota archaeon]